MKASRIAGFIALCVFLGSGWLLVQLFPGPLGFPLAGCVHFLLIGATASVVWAATRRARIALKSALVFVAVGVVLFASPGIVMHFTAGAVSELTSVVLFCSVPLMVVLAAGALGVAESGRGGLLVSVAGLGGALILFPVGLPSSLRGWTALILIALCGVLIALSSVVLYRTTQRQSLAGVVALASFASAVVLAGLSTPAAWDFVTPLAMGVELLRCAVFDLPVVWLSVWLVREVDPVRLSARFLIAPLVTALEGYLALRSGVDLQAGLGMIAMAVSGLMLVAARRTEELETLRLR